LVDEDLPAGLLDSLAFPASLLRRPRRFLGGDRAVHGAREAHAKVDADPVVDDFVHGSFVLGEIEVGEKPERSKGKREHRRDDFLAAVSANGLRDLQEPRREENGAVTAELPRRQREATLSDIAKAWRDHSQSRQSRRGEASLSTFHSSST
jgi:hypothetical protein